MEISKEKLNELYKALPHGSITLIASNAGCSTQAVRDVLKHGKYYNDAIVEEAFKIAGPIIKRRKEINSQIEKTLAK